MKRLLVLLAIIACHPIPLNNPPRQSFAGMHNEIVSDFNFWNTYDQVPRSMQRPGTDPIIGPYFYVFSKEHHFCLVSEHDYYYIAKLDQPYNCHWQFYRAG